jgi:16S rRNA processing protein RimM
MVVTEPGRATLVLGVLGRPHGVRGEIVFHAFNPGGTPLSGLPLPLSVDLRRGRETVAATLIAARPFKDGALVRLEGVDGRDAAAARTGFEMAVPREALPPLAEGEHYTVDLVGCAVFDTEGRARGRVQGAFWNGTHEVLTVVDEAGDELLIPVIGDFFVEIDLPQRRLVIDPHE